MRVAVVGGGVSGLAAIKCCRDEGLDVVCFERRNDLGGLWNYTETVEPGQSNVTRSTVTNTSKELTCYSDFPVPADFPNFMHHSKLLDYIRMYADHFQLEQYIRFETEVVSMEQQPDGDGRWSVTTRKIQHSDDFTTETFDAVMVCAGIHNDINMPNFEGQDEFKGELIHSVKYVFAPDLQPQTLAMIGCIGVAGPVPPLLEMQCRLAVKVFKGETRLPDSKTMWADVRRVKSMHEPSSGRRFVHYVPAMDELGHMIGCTPPNFFRLLVTDPRLAMAVYFGPATPCQYRLVGPGAWRGARDAILSSRERVLQPLKTRRVAIATTDNKMRSLLLLAFIVGAVAASAYMFYRRLTDWN